MSYRFLHGQRPTTNLLREGYQGYSEFLASDSDFCSFRKFDKLNVRVILALQDNISCLEEELKEIDEFYSRQDVPDENNGSFRFDARPERVKCLWKIKDALEEYSLYYPSTIAFGASEGNMLIFRPPQTILFCSIQKSKLDLLRQRGM